MADTTVSLLWRAADGSTWDWMAGTGGVTAGRGLSGLLFPEFEQRMTETRSGSRWAGTRFKPAKVNVTLQVGDHRGTTGNEFAGDAYRRGDAWRELDRRFRSSINPLKPGTLECTTPEGTRSLVLIPDSVGDKLEAWPDIRGWLEYDVDFTSETGLWSGSPISLSIPYTSGPTADYYQGRGPNFLISEGTVQAAQSVQNPGDAPAWPIWTITGPGAFTVGVGTKTTTTAALGTGETLVIDTERRSVADGTGAPAWNRLVQRQFAQIDRGSAETVTVTAMNTSSSSAVDMTIIPKHLGAY